MEELIKKIEEQYNNADYAGILDTVTEVNGFVDGLNNVINELTSDKEGLNEEIAKLSEENQKLKNANAALFLRANGAEASDPKPEPVATDYSAMINPDDFKI